MHPVAHEFFSGHAFALRNFRLVMWEYYRPRRKKYRSESPSNELPLRCTRCASRGDHDPRANPNPTTPSAFRSGFPKRKIANVFLLVLIVANASGWPQFFQIQMPPAFRNREIS